MTQLLSSLQKLYESKILEADHQIKHYSTNALAIADHSEFTKEIDKWIKEAEETGELAIDTETSSLDAHQAELIGISLSTKIGRACYIPIGHKSDRCLKKEVVLKKINCCGSLNHHLGKSELAHKTFKKNISIWYEEYLKNGLDAIISNTSGCGTTIKDYKFIFREHKNFIFRSSLARYSARIFSFQWLSGLSVFSSCLTNSHPSINPA